MPDRITLTREQLYERVWETPMARLAAEYALSDVGLAKLCARHKIPTPPRGYWAKREAGKPTRRPRLPPSQDTSPIHLTAPRSGDDGDPASDPLALALAELRRPENRIAVADRLHAPCDLVKEANAALKEATIGPDGLLERPRRCLDVRVSRAQCSRALRIADALLKAFEARGWTVGIESERTLVRVGDVAIALVIQELMETVELPPKPRLESTSYYAFHYEQRETAQQPSGRLSIGIEESERLWGYSQTRNWREAERPIEERLHLVVAGMLRLASAVVAERARRKRQEREQREREQQRQAALEEQRRLREALAREQANVAYLRDQAARWHESENLRRFVDEARRRGGLGELGLDADALAEWAEWALRQADRLDPFTPSPPSILDDAERIERMVDPGLVRR